MEFYKEDIRTQARRGWNIFCKRLEGTNSVSRRFTAPQSFPKAEKVLCLPPELDELREAASGLSEAVSPEEEITTEYDLTQVIDFPRECRLLEIPTHFYTALVAMARSYRQFRSYSAHDVAILLLGRALYGSNYEG